MPACLRPSPMAAIAGEGGDAKADGAQGTKVRMYPVTTLRRGKPMMPAKQASLAMDPTVTTVRGSLGATTGSLRSGPVVTATGEGRDAATAGAQENWVRRCVVTPPRRQTPAVPAKQAILAMDPTVTTVRGSRGPTTASPRPGSGDGCWRGQGCSGGRSTGDLGTEMPGDPPAATHAGGSREAGRPGDGPYCDDGQRLARSGLPQTRSSSGSCWRGRGCSGGKSRGELSTEVPGSPPVAGKADLGVVDCAADDELVEWWKDREEDWDSDAVLDEWDSVQTGDGYAEVHKTVFFPEGVDQRPLDSEGQLLVWDRHVLLRDLRGAVQQVPV